MKTRSLKASSWKLESKKREEMALSSMTWGYARIIAGTLLGGTLGFYVMHRIEVSYKVSFFFFFWESLCSTLDCVVVFFCTRGFDADEDGGSVKAIREGNEEERRRRESCSGQWRSRLVFWFAWEHAFKVFDEMPKRDFYSVFSFCFFLSWIFRFGFRLALWKCF